MSKYIKDDEHCIADLDDFTLSTGIYDYLYDEWYEKFSASVTLKLSEHEQRKVSFYAGMKAAQQMLAVDGACACGSTAFYNDKVLGIVCCRYQAIRSCSNEGS